MTNEAAVGGTWSRATADRQMLGRSGSWWLLVTAGMWWEQSEQSEQLLNMTHYPGVAPPAQCPPSPRRRYHPHTTISLCHLHLGHTGLWAACSIVWIFNWSIYLTLVQKCIQRLRYYAQYLLTMIFVFVSLQMCLNNTFNGILMNSC